MEDLREKDVEWLTIRGKRGLVLHDGIFPVGSWRNPPRVGDCISHPAREEDALIENVQPDKTRVRLPYLYIYFHYVNTFKALAWPDMFVHQIQWLIINIY